MVDKPREPESESNPRLNTAGTLIKSRSSLEIQLEAIRVQQIGS